MPQSIVLISSGQPSANPRLVKEAVALSTAGFMTSVIYVPISPWADAFDQALFLKHPHINFIQAGYHQTRQRRGYIWARTRRKALSKIFSFVGDVLNVADYSTILFGQELLKAAKRYKADLYIAHNLGALPVAYKVAQKYGAKFGFDAEDFHRGEVSLNDKNAFAIKLIEDKYFPLLDYFSAASPITHSQYQKLYPQVRSLIVNNAFEKKYIVSNTCSWNSVEPLNMIWFSQTVGKGRGIEDVVKATCEELKDELVTLTLLGNCSEETKRYFEDLVPKDIFNQKVYLKEPVPPEELFKLSSKFHIGLALEPGRDMNNNFALSNKLFTYVIAGNAVIASDTAAQIEFMNSYPGVGLMYHKGDFKSLANVIKQYLKNPSLLAEHQKESLRLAGTVLNWETESKKFLDIIAAVLDT